MFQNPPLINFTTKIFIVFVIAAVLAGVGGVPRRADARELAMPPTPRTMKIGESPHGPHSVSVFTEEGESGLPSAADTPETWLMRQWGTLPLGPIDDTVEQLDPSVRRHLPSLNYRDIVHEGVDWTSIGQTVLNTVWAEFRLQQQLLKQLLVLGLLSAFLQTVAHSFGRSGAADMAVLASVLMLVFIALGAFDTTIDTARSALKQMTGLLQSLMPVMAMMLAAVGAVTTAAVFHPLVYATVTGVATLVETVIFPGVLAGTALAVVGSISPSLSLRRLESLFRSSLLLLLSALFMFFVVAVQMRGLVTPVADGLAVRSAKFLTSTFIPVVGSRIADAMDVIVGGSTLIKNAVGLFGMVAVALVTLFPVLRILTVLLMFKVVAAMIEPISDDRLTNAMSGMAGGIGLIAAGLVTVALMFFVGILVIVGVGNTTAFLR